MNPCLKYFDRKEDCLEGAKTALEKNISLMDICLDALEYKSENFALQMAILVENDRKNEWLFPYLLKLLYLDTHFLVNRLGHFLFCEIHKALANTYTACKTCDMLLINFIVDKNLDCNIQSIGLDTLSILALNGIMSEEKFRRMMKVLIPRLDKDMKTNMALTCSNHGICSEEIKKMFLDNQIDEDAFSFETYLSETKEDPIKKKEELRKNPFFTIEIPIFEYILEYLGK